MRPYELTVLIHPDLEIDLEKPLGKVREIIGANGGTIKTEENWGKKKLAYRVKREDFAVYVHIELDLPAESVSKVDTTLNITDPVLRHLLVSFDPKRPDETEAEGEETDTETEEKTVKEG